MRGEGAHACANMHVQPISIPRATSPHAAASAQPHSRARLRACCNRGSRGRPRLCRSGQDTVHTHVVFFIHVSALLDQVRHQLDHALLSRIKERMLGSVLAQRCLDLLLLDLITAAFGAVESGFAALKRAGVSAGAWRGRACMCEHACAANLHPSRYLAARCCLGTATQSRTIASMLQQGVAWAPPSMQKRTRHGSHSRGFFHSR